MDDKNVSTICFWRNIVLQCTFFQLQFWRLRLYIVYNTTYSHISVNSAVELHSWDTGLNHNHKSTLFALKSCRLNISYAFCSDALFNCVYAWSARTLKACQIAPNYWTKLCITSDWANTVKNTQCLHINTAYNACQRRWYIGVIYRRYIYMDIYGSTL